MRAWFRNWDGPSTTQSTLALSHNGRMTRFFLSVCPIMAATISFSSMFLALCVFLAPLARVFGVGHFAIGLLVFVVNVSQLARVPNRSGSPFRVSKWLGEIKIAFYALL